MSGQKLGPPYRDKQALGGWFAKSSGPGQSFSPTPMITLEFPRYSRYPPLGTWVGRLQVADLAPALPHDPVSQDYFKASQSCSIIYFTYHLSPIYVVAVPTTPPAAAT